MSKNHKKITKADKKRTNAPIRPGSYSFKETAKTAAKRAAEEIAAAPRHKSPGIVSGQPRQPDRPHNGYGKGKYLGKKPGSFDRR